MSQTSQIEADRAGTDASGRSAEADRRGKSRNVRALKVLQPFLARYRLRIGLAGIFLVIAAAATLVVPVAARRMIDKGFTPENAAQIDQYFGGLILVVVVMAVASAARFYMVGWLGERVTADIRKAVYGHVIALNPAFFEFTRTGEVLSRLTTDTTLVQTVVGSGISIALRNMVMLAGALAAMVWTSAQLSLVVLVAGPAVLIPIIIFGRKVRGLSRTAQDKIAETSAIAGESMSAVTTVQAFTREQEERSRFGRAAEEAFHAARKRLGMRAIMTAVAIVISLTSVVAVLWFGAQMVIAGTISGGELVQFLFYAILVATSAGALSEVWGDVMRAAGASERLADLLNVMPEITAPAQPAALPAVVSGRVTFEGIRFAYPTRPDSAALNDFSLEVAPGETVALVGPSGAGKSTVLQLLLRFYDPQGGAVRLDGVPIDALDPMTLRRHLALVPQDPAIFAASIAENIAYGRPGASAEEIRMAAKAAAADDFIRALPQGYDTPVGERGITLSGGQKQRLAIARAILKDAPVLLLDEATSALDAENERLVQQALDKVMEGRTTLVIAHRLATVLKADRIVVMDRGGVVETGTHHELRARGGLYARLAELQFATPDAPAPEKSLSLQES